MNQEGAESLECQEGSRHPGPQTEAQRWGWEGKQWARAGAGGEGGRAKAQGQDWRGRQEAGQCLGPEDLTEAQK